MKIIYQGYIYEAVKVNDSFEKYIDELIERLKKGNFEDFTSNVLDNRGNELPITTSLSNRNNSLYYTLFNEPEHITIKSRKIEIPSGGISLRELRDDMLHELLHAIDPKTYVGAISEKKWGGGGYIKPKTDDNGRYTNLKEYRNQLMERDVHLSQIAYSIVKLRLEHNGYDRTKKDISSGKILESLAGSPELRNEENDKIFLKLCYTYLDRLKGNDGK